MSNIAVDTMSNKELLTLLIDELTNNGKTWKTDKELYSIIFPKGYKEYQNNSSNWSNWLKHGKGKINNLARIAIQEHIGFSGDIWHSDRQTQVKTIKKAVKIFLYPTITTITLNIPDTALTDTPVTSQQQLILNQLRKLKKEEIESILEKNRDFLEKTIENQTFLIKLIEPLYNKGVYDFLIDSIFSSLLPHNLDIIKIKIIYAHTLGIATRPDYLEASSILKTLSKDKLTPNIINIQTALISNLRRLQLEKKDLTAKELPDILTLLREQYNTLVEYHQNHHYYPAINLMYILKLILLTTDNQNHIMENDLKSLYQDANSSIKKDFLSSSKESIYYAQMSDIEFQLLLDRMHLKKTLELILEQTNPLHTWVERTSRQLTFFLNMVEKFSKIDSSKTIKNVREIIEILNDYVVYKK